MRTTTAATGTRSQGIHALLLHLHLLLLIGYQPLLLGSLRGTHPSAAAAAAAATTR
jgi:hypothetical protein